MRDKIQTSLKSTKERRRRSLPAEALRDSEWLKREVGEDGYTLPQVGVVYTRRDLADAIGLISLQAVEQDFGGEWDCLRDVALYVAAKIFGREAEAGKKERMRCRRRVII